MTEVYVYTVTRRETGDQYVGISKSPKTRWRAHRWHARHGSKGHFHQAVAKYGPEAFDWNVCAKMPSLEFAQKAERFLIAVNKPHYNSSEGGDGNWGYVPSAEARAKLSATHTGMKRPPRTPAHKQALGASRRGKALAPEHRAKIAAAMQREDVKAKCAAGRTGRQATDEHRAKISAGLKAAWQKPLEEGGRAGTKMTAEQRANIGAGRRQAWARQKAGA